MELRFRKPVGFEGHSFRVIICTWRGTLEVSQHHEQLSGSSSRKSRPRQHGAEDYDH